MTTRTTESGVQTVRVGLAVPGMSAIYGHLAALTSLGYDRDEGLALEFSYHDVPDRAADALAAGVCDLTLLNTTVGVVGRGRGLPMVAVYGMAHRTHRWFAVLPDSPVRSLGDLAGKTVSCDVANLRPLAECALADEGVDPAAVRFVDWRGSDMEARQMLPVLDAGEVDAVFIIDWNHGNLVAEGRPLRRVPSRMLDAITLSSCAWTRPDFADGSPGMIAGFGRALARATLFSLHAPRETVRRMWEDYPACVPRGDAARARDRAVAVLEARLEPMRPDEGPGWRWGALHAHEMARWVELLQASGGLAGPVDPRECLRDDHVDAFNDFDPEAVIAQARRSG